MNPESQIHTTTAQETGASLEFSKEALDLLVVKSAEDVMQIDTHMRGNDEFTWNETPVTQKYREALLSLEGKTPEELRSLIDPDGRFPAQDFSSFELSVEPPGTVHIELGNTSDLKKFREILNKGKLNIFAFAAIGDQRDVETFGAQYFSPKVFGGGNYLGVIVSVREHTQDQKVKKAILKHEYSHALIQEVIRPLAHRKVVNIGLGDKLYDIRSEIDNMGRVKADQLAEALGVLPNAEMPDHMRPLIIGSDIVNEQFMLDELRAYTFNTGPLYPKRQITDKELEGEDSTQSAKVEMVQKYFRVNLLHTKARIISHESSERSTAILGAALSLDQARRLLEQDAVGWRFSEGDSDDAFEYAIEVTNKLLTDPEYAHYRDFHHKEGGELISQEEMRQTLVPSKEMIDAEILRRYGGILNAPQELQQNYAAIYVT